MILDTPQPTSGPTARMQMNDPATQAMVGTGILAVLSLGASLIPHSGIPAVPLDGSMVTAVVTMLLVFTHKHILQGKLISRATVLVQAAGPIIAEAEAIPAVHQVTAEVVAQLAADPTAVAIESILQDALAKVQAAKAPAGH